MHVATTGDLSIVTTNNPLVNAVSRAETYTKGRHDRAAAYIARMSTYTLAALDAPASKPLM
ncbi:hypothetical protein [Ruegeria profundi]|nr:hypothetical protein [Ruegeria profundi]